MRFAVLCCRQAAPELVLPQAMSPAPTITGSLEDGVGVGLATEVAVGVAVAVGVEVGSGVLVGVKVGVGEGVGVAVGGVPPTRSSINWGAWLPVSREEKLIDLEPGVMTPKL